MLISKIFFLFLNVLIHRKMQFFYNIFVIL